MMHVLEVLLTDRSPVVQDGGRRGDRDDRRPRIDGRSAEPLHGRKRRRREASDRAGLGKLGDADSLDLLTAALRDPQSDQAAARCGDRGC